MERTDLESPRRRSIDIGDPDGGAIAAIEFGPADRPVDIVFCHANGFNALTYRALLEPLGADLRVLAIDQRGHGRTSLKVEPEGRANWDDLASDLVDVLDRLGGPPVTLAGHSMGGTASVLAAARRPARVARLVLLEPVILPRLAAFAFRLGFPERRAPGLRRLAEGALRRKTAPPSRLAAAESFVGRGAFKTWERGWIEDYVADGFRDRPDGGVELACDPRWEASNFLAHGHDVWAALGRLACPVDILRGAQGGTCSLTKPLSVRMSVETVSGTTHFLPMERPDLVRERLRSSPIRGGAL